MHKDKRYWDSNVIIAYLNNERGRADVCHEILSEAEAGKIQLYTSALTIAEVLKLKGKKPIRREDRDKVIEFFQNEYIIIINVDRWIAGLAQNLYWDYKVPPKDAIHVASAIKIKLPILETYDQADLLSQGSITFESHTLALREPVGRADLPLFSENKEKGKDNG